MGGTRGRSTTKKELNPALQVLAQAPVINIIGQRRSIRSVAARTCECEFSLVSASASDHRRLVPQMLRPVRGAKTTTVSSTVSFIDFCHRGRLWRCSCGGKQRPPRSSPVLPRATRAVPPGGPSPPFRRHTGRFPAELSSIHRYQPPRARLLACLHPTSRPAEFQRRTTPHWHVVVPSVAPARVIALAVGAPPFLCPAARSTDPADCNAELRPC